MTLGVISTPGVAYLTRVMNAHAGVMISASHNPVADNGIKFFGADGYKLTDEQEEEIETLLNEQKIHCHVRLEQMSVQLRNTLKAGINIFNT